MNNLAIPGGVKVKRFYVLLNIEADGTLLITVAVYNYLFSL